MNEKSTPSGLESRRSGHRAALVRAKSRAALRVIEGGALETTSGSSRPPEQFGAPALFLREVRSSFNYCIYFCARWIGRVQRHRFEAPLRS
jgi:hypothetical protein